MLRLSPSKMVSRLGIACCLLAGCGTASLPVTARIDSVDSNPATQQSEEKQKKVEIEPVVQNTDAKKDVASNGESPQVTAILEVAEYEPPFPDRTDLFKVPKRQGRGFANTPEGIEKAVELLGFVNVDSPQVVLSVDGMVTPLEVGSKIAEIEVISIQPPAVVLQRGRQRWQETLEN